MILHVHVYTHHHSGATLSPPPLTGPALRYHYLATIQVVVNTPLMTGNSSLETRHFGGYNGFPHAMFV